MRSLPRYRFDRSPRSSAAADANSTTTTTTTIPPAFTSREDFLEYERALAEAARLDDALNASLAASAPAERAEADAAVEAAMVPCVDFVTRRNRRKIGGEAGSGGGSGGEEAGAAAAAVTTKKENAPPAATTATPQQTDCPSSSSCPPPLPPPPLPPPPPPAAVPSFLARFSALGVRLTCATAAASWLEGKRRRAEADEIYHGCLGVTAPLSSSSSISSPSSPSGTGQQQSSHEQPPFFFFRRRGHWWTRLALNAEASGRPSQALELVEAALADDEENVSWGDRLGLMRRGFRLARPPRRWRAPPAAWAEAAGREPRERVLVAATINNNFPATTALSFLSLSSSSSNAKSVFEGNLTVEQLALDFYSRPKNGGWKGAHAEGGVWGCLFRALFHDVMFPTAAAASFSSSEIDDTRGGGTGGGGAENRNSSSIRALSMLRVPCQRYPLDFGSPLFYELRKPAIDSLLRRIRAASAAEVAGMVSGAWDRGLGPYAAGGTEGRWNRSGPGGGREELRELCGCLGGRALAAVLELFAKGVAREGGMPDLVLWRRRRRRSGGGGGGERGGDEANDADDGDGDKRDKSESPSSSNGLFGEAMVVEVKGPRDRLSVRFFGF